MGCSNITSVTFGSTMRRIEKDVFKDCLSLRRAYFDDITNWMIKDKNWHIDDKYFNAECKIVEEELIKGEAFFKEIL